MATLNEHYQHLRESDFEAFRNLRNELNDSGELRRFDNVLQYGKFDFKRKAAPNFRRILTKYFGFTEEHYDTNTLPEIS